jgi:hypothetical protein
MAGKEKMVKRFAEAQKKVVVEMVKVTCGRKIGYEVSQE